MMNGKNVQVYLQGPRFLLIVFNILESPKLSRISLKVFLYSTGCRPWETGCLFRNLKECMMTEERQLTKVTLTLLFLNTFKHKTIIRSLDPRSY